MKKNIAIFGGGITGLVASYNLVNKGHHITIIEKDGFLGGLAGSFKIHNQNLEKTYHHIFQSDEYALKLFRKLGIDNKLKWHKSSIAIYNRKTLHPFSTPMDLIKFKEISLFSRIRTGIVTLFLQKFKNWKRFENIPASRWLKKWNGKQAYNTIWEPLLKGKFHALSEKISMAWLWARIFSRANSRKRPTDSEKQGTFLTRSEHLGYPDGGFQILINALREFIEQRDTRIMLNTFVQNLEMSPNESIGLKIDNQFLYFDQVIFTTPSDSLLDLLPEARQTDSDYITKLKSIDYIGAVCMVFSSSQSLSSYYWHNINDRNIPFLVFVQHTNLIPKRNYDNNHVYYIGGYYPQDHSYFSMDDQAIKIKWLNALQLIFPDLDMDLIQATNIFKFKYAQHVVDTDYRKKIPDYKTPYKNIFLANFSQIYPEDRGINYAIREGEKIAELIN